MLCEFAYCTVLKWDVSMKLVSNVYYLETVTSKCIMKSSIVLVLFMHSISLYLHHHKFSHSRIASAPFNCSIIRPETSKELRQVIAGQYQSQQAAVDQQTLSERFKHLCNDIVRRSSEGLPPNFRESMVYMYQRGGFVASREPTVCPQTSSCPMCI